IHREGIAYGVLEATTEAVARLIRIDANGIARLSRGLELGEVRTRRQVGHEAVIDIAHLGAQGGMPHHVIIEAGERSRAGRAGKAIEAEFAFRAEAEVAESEEIARVNTGQSAVNVHRVGYEAGKLAFARGIAGVETEGRPGEERL